MNVNRIGSEYAVRHVGVYWAGGTDFNGRRNELPGASQICIIMKDGGVALDQYLVEHVLSYMEQARLTVGLADAVAALHDMKQVRRDLKPSNVLVNESMEVRLCDLEGWHHDDDPLDDCEVAHVRVPQCGACGAVGGVRVE